MKGKHSLRASITSELIFDNVFLPEENLLPKTDGLKNALMCLNQARYGICLLYTSDAADERSSVDLGGRRIIKKKKTERNI